MPKVLEDCIKALKLKGIPDDRAYKICTKQTGWVRGKNKNGKATWRKKKNG